VSRSVGIRTGSGSAIGRRTSVSETAPEAGATHGGVGFIGFLCEMAIDSMKLQDDLRYLDRFVACFSNRSLFDQGDKKRPAPQVREKKRYFFIQDRFPTARIPLGGSYCGGRVTRLTGCCHNPEVGTGERRCRPPFLRSPVYDLILDSIIRASFLV